MMDKRNNGSRKLTGDPLQSPDFKRAILNRSLKAAATIP